MYEKYILNTRCTCDTSRSSCSERNEGTESTLGTANSSPLSLPHWGPRAISGLAAEFLTKACSLPVTVSAL